MEAASVGRFDLMRPAFSSRLSRIAELHRSGAPDVTLRVVCRFPVDTAPFPVAFAPFEQYSVEHLFDGYCSFQTPVWRYEI